jgi:hypothetical protein
MDEIRGVSKSICHELPEFARIIRANSGNSWQKLDKKKVD